MSYNPDFTRNSKGQFNIDNNFMSVKSGSEAYLIEDELNEMQWIQNELRAQSLRSLLSSGFLYNTLNILDTNSNKDESIYVKGYGNPDLEENAILFNIKNYIPLNINGYMFKVAGTYKKDITGAITTNNNILLKLPPPPVSSPRYDLIYLEVWFEELDCFNNNSIKYYGGMENDESSKLLPDARLNVETTHRIQLKWDLRVVQGTQYITDKIVKPKGKSSNNNYVLANSILDKTFSKDPNIYVSINNLDGTLDGTYYAIPIISIYRLEGQTTLSASNCLSQIPIGSLLMTNMNSDQVIIGHGDDKDIIILNNNGNVELHDKTGKFIGLEVNYLTLDDNISSKNDVTLVSSNGALEVKNSNLINYADIVVGNLTVKGTTTTVNSQIVNIADNIIVLNSDVITGTPTENGGIQVSRGSQPKASLIWSESGNNGLWKCGTEGNESIILTDVSPEIKQLVTIKGMLEPKIILQSTDTSNDHSICILDKSGRTLSQLEYANSLWKMNGYNAAVINASSTLTDTSGNVVNAATSSKLLTARNIVLSGAVNGSAIFDGSANINIATTINNGNDGSQGSPNNTKSLFIANNTKKIYFDTMIGSTKMWLQVGGQDTIDWSHITNAPSSIAALDGNFNYGTTAPSNSTRLNYNGNFYATRIYNSVYNDYAEYFEKGEVVEPGDVIACSLNSNKYIKSNEKYSNLVIGVFSDSYGQCIGGRGDGNDTENFIPIGLSGRVSVKVTGDINKGDLLVSSDIPGVAMKSEQYTPGTIIGKALENHKGQSIDKIKIFIMNI